jgi:hypothetical protein
MLTFRYSALKQVGMTAFYMFNDRDRLEESINWSGPLLCKPFYHYLLLSIPTLEAEAKAKSPTQFFFLVIHCHVLIVGWVSLAAILVLLHLTIRWLHDSITVCVKGATNTHLLLV